MARYTNDIILAVLAVLLVIPVAIVLTIRATDDRPQLSDKRDEAFPLFEETALLVDPDYETHRFSGSNPGSPYDLPNDPFGYDDCDDWKGWVLPGWSAFAFHDFEVGSRDEVIQQVEELWSQYPGELERRPAVDPRPLILRDGPIRWTLTFPVNSPFDFEEPGSINVGIDCLPA